MQHIYRIRTAGRANESNMIRGGAYRITVLTPGLLRLEYDESGVFEDRATQTVLYRDFPEASYRVLHTSQGLEIHTKRLHLVYNEKEFCQNGLHIQVKGNFSAYHSIWRYGEKITDLGGTARTLDEADGAVGLDHGVVSKNGFSVLDDSRSHVLLEDGWLTPRRKGVQDLYFWGYGHDHKEALADFYRLCGASPMLPRYALGNWWSRYYKYTEKSYLELMDRFQENQIPFTVAVIDMDWHVTDIDPKYGSGWTGYTWNRELFPDPDRFLRALHERGMKTTLNVHPADGVRAHEDMYGDMARALGVEEKAEDPVLCDPADPDFLEAYFQYLHHPHERRGVDFWWIDWQQGSSCKVEGLDPLWIFNHYHFLDSGRNGKRPMTFSRYAGPGSHRYPVGFSGDTIITWESLDFQPYFTANASNIGYGWWSHDIGGHMRGYKSDELMIRWLQFGVYSPVNRLHSSCSEFSGKEPWRYGEKAERIMGEWLRQRHRMIPYLYTMNHRNYADSLPPLLPMYYEWQDEEEAYHVPNQYCFGSEMIVAPITGEGSGRLQMASVRVWLPKGVWYDMYTGMIYRGDRTIRMYRTTDSIPVLARAGGIVPYTDEIEASQAQTNPQSMHIYVYAGADGEFTLYEDDNVTCSYETGDHCRTRMSYTDEEEGVFTILPPEGNISLIPERRAYIVEITGFSGDARTAVTIGNVPSEAAVSYISEKQAIIVDIPPVDVTSRIEIRIIRADGRTGQNKVPCVNAIRERCFALLDRAQISFMQKDRIYEELCRSDEVPMILSQLQAIGTEPDLLGALSEILTAL